MLAQDTYFNGGQGIVVIAFAIAEIAHRDEELHTVARYKLIVFACSGYLLHKTSER
jgi:hypothetical protein